jgi:glutathionylspermidine amidase/synthetase
MHGNMLVEQGSKLGKYFLMDISSHLGLIHASEELHKMFLHATEHVISGVDNDYPNFHLPPEIFDQIKISWNESAKKTISGRFDFCLTQNGIKCYEYNADSASCLLECGLIQNRWAEGVGIGSSTRDPNSHLFLRLVNVWKDSNVKGMLHLLHDKDMEEEYHSLYMKKAAEEAGISCKIYDSIDSFNFDAEHNIMDTDGDIVKNIWKTWSWQTALNDLESKNDSSGKNPRLSDLLFNSKIRVFEPLWTVIMSSKAILPVIWRLYPNHPLLLNSSFELDDDLRRKGYATKPINGRCGGNIQLLSPIGSIIEKTDGKWDAMDTMYQEISLLPNYDGDRVQVNAWIIGGNYGGTVLRVDKKNIVGLDSSVYCLRIEKHI